VSVNRPGYEHKGSPLYAPSGKAHTPEVRQQDESYYWDKAANVYYHALCAHDHGRYAGTMTQEGRHAVCQRCGRRLEVAVKVQAAAHEDGSMPLVWDGREFRVAAPGDWLQLNPDDTFSEL
jgi:hypothetical protein